MAPREGFDVAVCLGTQRHRPRPSRLVSIGNSTISPCLPTLARSKEMAAPSYEEDEDPQQSASTGTRRSRDGIAVEPPGPASWGYQHRLRTAGKRPREGDRPPPTAGSATSPVAVNTPPRPGSSINAVGGVGSGGFHIGTLARCSRCRVAYVAGGRSRIRLREPAIARNHLDLMGAGLVFLWPRTMRSCVFPLELMSGRTALLVEDNEINRVVVRRLVREVGMGLEEAENGKVAVDFIREGRAYDLILMDKEMPVMDGHEATKQLRSLGVRTPIVALSGNNRQADMDLFLEAGADDFISKPLSKDQFGRILTKYGLHGHT